MIEAVKADIELSECFLQIDVTALGSHNLRIVCMAKNYTVKVSFLHFEGLENRSEFFERRDSSGIKTPLLPNSNYFFPISCIPYEQFKNSLSGYESMNAFDETKLWRFLSIQNFVEVYSTDIPVIEKIWCDNSFLLE